MPSFTLLQLIDEDDEKLDSQMKLFEEEFEVESLNVEFLNPDRSNFHSSYI
jgi:hypothetical protein